MIQGDNERTIPLYQEHVDVEKVAAITDRLRISTHVEERVALIEADVEHGQLSVERVAVERAVSQAPEPRQEGDTLIVAVVEERLVVEKRLFVIEELRITRTSTTEHVSRTEMVRTMRASVEHAEPSPATSPATGN